MTAYLRAASLFLALIGCFPPGSPWRAPLAVPRLGGSSCSQESALDGSFSREGPATGMPERHAQQSSPATRA
jgi:hypothetical protein